VRLGILGCGSIAAELADASSRSGRVTVVSAASRDAERAAGFARRHGIPRWHGSYQELLEDPAIDAVYVATPHRQHAEWTRAAVSHHKHVLCEKPLTVNAGEAEAVIAAARESGMLVMEAFAYLFHPQTHALLQLLGQGRIGGLREIAVRFSFTTGDTDRSRVIDHALAGGGILDVGCYCVSMAQLITGQEPIAVTGTAELDPVQRVDLHAVGTLTFPRAVMAQVECAVALEQPDQLRISGAEGEIVIDRPCWIPECRDADTRIELHTGTGTEVIEIGRSGHIFAIELDGFAQLIDAGAREWEQSWAQSLATLRTLDRWRAAVGVSYDWE
jgi:predicted dehydrogenase